MLIVLRSLVFNIMLWVTSIVMMIALLPTLLLPKFPALIPGIWGGVCGWVLKIFGGISYHVEGRENLPKGAFIVASKHQSAWETMAYGHIFKKTVFILKKELLYFVPINFYMIKTGMIPLDRKGGKKALQDMLERARETFKQNRPIVIFPEGTRTAVGQKAPYKKGVYTLYKHLEKPVVPVALNSGLYWKRRGFKKYPGTIQVKIMPPIQPGLSREEFMKTLETTIETESQKLINEAKK